MHYDHPELAQLNYNAHPILTYLSDDRPELVEIAEPVGRETQLANAAVELVGTLERVALVRLQMVLSEVAPILCIR